jgi:hypothetical protein
MAYYWIYTIFQQLTPLPSSGDYPYIDMYISSYFMFNISIKLPPEDRVRKSLHAVYIKYT